MKNMLENHENDDIARILDAAKAFMVEVFDFYESRGVTNADEQAAEMIQHAISFITALTQEFDCKVSDLEFEEDYIKTLNSLKVSVGSAEYIIDTDDNFDERARINIEDSLWAFNAEFIVDNTDLPCEAVEMVRSHQEKLCEGANDTIRALIKDMPGFVKAAISDDGRGHFLSSYDGDENDFKVEDGYYCYFRES